MRPYDAPPPVDRGPGGGRHRGGVATHRPLRGGQLSSHTEGAGATRQDGGLVVLRGLDSHQAQLRDGSPSPVCRCHDVLGLELIGQQGGVPPRHRRDHRGHGHRRGRGPTPRLRRPVAGGPVAARAVGGERGRRLARAPHPSPARLLHDPRRATAARCGSPGPRSTFPGRSAHRHRRRHPPQPGGPLGRPGFYQSRRSRDPGRAAHPAAALAGRLAGRALP